MNLVAIHCSVTNVLIYVKCEQNTRLFKLFTKVELFCVHFITYVLFIYFDV